MKIKQKISKASNIFALGFSLAKTNFKLRNEGSYFGILWYLLEPIAFFFIILLMGGAINLHPVEFYPLYLFLGLIMFNFFTSSTSSAVKSITGNSSIIKSIKLSQESFVISSALQFAFSHFIEFGIFAALMVYFGANVFYIIFYLPIFLFFSLFVFGVSFAVAAIGVYVRDLANIWAVAARLLWFLTPVFYKAPANELYQQINHWNPLYYFINISREIIIYRNIPEFYALMAAVFSSFVIFFAGLAFFKKFKSSFPEKI